MSTKPCAFCGEPAEQTDGRRPRKFCTDTCRQKYWQAKNKLKAAAKTEKTTAVVKKMSPSVKLAKNEPTDIEKQIAAIKAEKIPKDRDTIFGRKSWALDQRKRIAELESKLNGVEAGI